MAHNLPAIIGDDMESQSKLLAKRIADSVTKLYTHYDISTQEFDHTISIVFASIGVLPRILWHFNRAINGNYNLLLDRTHEYCTVTAVGKNNGEMGFNIQLENAQIQFCALKHKNIAVKDSDTPIYLDDFQDGNINAEFAEYLAQKITGKIGANFNNSSNLMRVNKNSTQTEHMRPLLKALLLDPDLTPKMFFDTYQAEREQQITKGFERVALTVAPIDINEENTIREKDVTALQNNPDGTKMTLFGNRAMTAAATASTAISDWQMRFQYAAPHSFRLMGQLHDTVRAIQTARGENNANPRMLLSHFDKISKTINEITRKIPEDSKAIGNAITDIELAKHAMQSHAALIEAYKDDFKENANMLQESGFNGEIINAKLTVLRQSTLAAQQKTAGIDHSTLPVMQQISLSLMQMMVDVDLIAQSLQKAKEDVLLTETKRHAGDKFNLASAGVTIRESRKRQFASLTPEQAEQIAEKSLDALAQKTEKWATTVKQTEDILLQIENGEAPRLLITYQEESDSAANENGLTPVGIALASPQA